MPEDKQPVLRVIPRMVMHAVWLGLPAAGFYFFDTQENGYMLTWIVWVIWGLLMANGRNLGILLVEISLAACIFQWPASSAGFGYGLGVAHTLLLSYSFRRYRRKD